MCDEEAHIVTVSVPSCDIDLDILAEEVAAGEQSPHQLLFVQAVDDA